MRETDRLIEKEMLIHIKHYATEVELIGGKLVETPPHLSESYMLGQMVRYGKDDTVLVYPEGNPGMMTILHFTPEKVTIRRNGSHNITLRIEEGKRSISYFETQIGSVALGVSGQNISADFNEEGGIGSFSYQLDTNLKLVGTHRFQFTVRRRSQQ